MTDAQLALLVSASSATVALLSVTWTIGWSVWQYRRLHRPRVTVLAANALPTYGPRGAGEWCVSVTVVNDGAVAITLTGLKFVVRNDRQRRGLFPRQWAHTEPQSLPVKLTPGDRWLGLTEQKALSETLREQFGDRG